LDPSQIAQLETLCYEQSGAIGWLRLNRAQKLNAMTPKMWAELRELGQTLSGDESLRALVVIGEGRAFSPGIDTSAFSGNTFKGHEREPVPEVVTDDDPLVSIIQGFQEAFTWLEEAPYPTIAAVRGFALGGGMQLALACDIRVVARGTKLELLEHRYGLIPDLGGTQRLPRLVGRGKAKELIFTAQQIEADEAYRIGLAEQLVDDESLESTVTALANSWQASLRCPCGMQNGRLMQVRICPFVTGCYWKRRVRRCAYARTMRKKLFGRLWKNGLLSTRDDKKYTQVMHLAGLQPKGLLQ